MLVGDYRTRVAGGLQNSADQLVEVELLGTRYLHGSVQGRFNGDVGERRDDVIGHDRLDVCRRHTQALAVCALLRNAGDELEELRRAQNRVRHRRRLDQILLGHLGAKVAAFLKAFRADHGQRHVMAHPSHGFRVEQIASGCLKEPHDRVVLERRRVCDIDDDLGAGQCFCKTLAGQCVDSRVGGRCEHVLAHIAQSVDEL